VHRRRCTTSKRHDAGSQVEERRRRRRLYVTEALPTMLMMPQMSGLGCVRSQRPQRSGV